MKGSTLLKLIGMGILEAALGIALLVLLPIAQVAKIFILIGVVAVSLTLDALLLRADSAAVVSDAKRLKDASDYIEAFQAWLREDTPFVEEVKIAIRQLESLQRKQQALLAVLGSEASGSPFLSTAKDVDAYVLANCKRVLNRVMIYDAAEPQKYQTHVMYLRQILGQNAHVLSDFENLILEVSQIGDNQTVATPCLNELTAALRSVRDGGEDAWAVSNAQITRPPVDPSVGSGTTGQFM